MFRDSFVAALDAYRSASSGDDGEWKRYWDCIEESAHHGNKAFIVATQFSASTDRDRHHVALDLLGKIAELSPKTGDAVATAVLEAISGRSDGHLLASAANSFGKARSERGVPFLLGCLDGDVQPVRMTAVVALSMCAEKSRVGLAALIAATGDADPEIRVLATFGLGMNTDADTPAVRDTLAKCLFDEFDDVRNEAMRGLARRGDDRATSAVREALRRSPYPPPQVLDAATLLCIS